jgi:heat-inducible transcriptional repressor
MSAKRIANVHATSLYFSQRKIMSPRQEQILSSIVEQYAEVASPVGSSLLAKVFDVSSATIRSDMVELERAGLIMQPHTSAGRIPTDKGYRYYVNLTTGIKETESQDRKVQRALSARMSPGNIPERTIKSTVDTLVEMTHNLGLATIGDQFYMSGLSNLFGQPDFVGQDQIRSVASLLDNIEPWLKEAAPNQPINVYIGRENPIGRDSGCTLIVSRFRSPYSDNSYIGVLGPTRQSYRSTIALVKRAGETLEEFLL